MGNNNSHPVQTAPVEVVRRPPSRPNVPPSARPTSELGPRGPSYLDPGNQVLPKELPSILKLRPVSMELSKYNPDYHNIYEDENIDNTLLDDNENNIEKSTEVQIENNSFPPRPPPPMPNGHIINQSETVTPNTPSSSLPNGHIQSPPPPPQNVTPNNTKNAPYRPSHRRQMSLGQDHVILEEPEEIDNRVKLDPLMQSFPGATGPSLPVKNNFNLDYSYQLTYVQLAEHRRNKTIEELEKRTGKRLSDLSADLSEHIEKPAFVRDDCSRVSTRSTGSGNKKKKAPPPPGQSSTPTTPRQRPYSVDNEPPIDYDMESPRRPAPAQKYTSNKIQNGILPRYSAAVPPVSRVSPSVSKVPPPPTPPPPKGMAQSPRKPVNISRNNSMNETPQLVLRKRPDVKPSPKAEGASDGHVPWLLEIKNLSEAKAARRQQSLESSETPALEAESSNNIEANNVGANKTTEISTPTQAKSKLVFESSNENLVDTKSENKDEEPEKKSLERSNSLKEKDVIKTPSAKLQRHSSTTTFDRLSSQPKVERQISAPVDSNNGDPVRRLNSLLQHDIKATASAKCLKLVKQTTATPPKPKDPHTVFREQLQKACTARDKRAETDGTIDEQLQRNNSNASFEVGEVLDDDKVNEKISSRRESTKSSTSSNPPDVLPKPPRYHKNVTLNRNSNVYTKRASSFVADKSPSNSLQRQQQPPAMSLDWTPEVDLDSDDNLSDREEVTRRKGASDGFKSSIIPNQMSEMKTKKRGKEKKNKVNGNVPTEENNNKNKFGSVKKFKKSMHKSVKNAFGSISKASGKLLRKQKTEELEIVEDPPKNWSLTANHTGHTSRHTKYALPNGIDHDYGSDSDEEHYIHENEFSEMSYRQNGHVESEEDSSEPEADSPQPSKRASLYKMGKGQGQISDEEELEVRGQGQRYERSKVIMSKKKNKYSTNEASLKRKEKGMDRDTEELLAIRDRERRVEEERRKQLETELEIHKLREAETRERLQRLENAHLQQQLTTQLLQQQQQQQHQQLPQQNLGMLSAPPLPPAGNFPNYATLPFGQQVPQNGFPQNYGLYSQSNPYMNGGTIPGMSYDLNDYMRMLGVQSPPTSQQMAFFLNNMTLTGQQPFDKKSNPLLFDMYNQSFNPTGNLGFQGMDTGSMKKQNFQTWASTPNIHATQSVPNNSVPLGDFVASYNGANNTNTAKSDKDENDSNKQKSCNPVYDSDNSDEGLSPKKTVARVHVKDYRPVPVRSESGKFMRKYATENFGSQNDAKSQSTNYSDVNTNISLTGDFLHRQRSVSPSNSVSTVDSAITTSPSVTLSTPSSPSVSVGAPASPMLTGKSSGRSNPSFKTVVDLSNPLGSTTQIISADGENF